MENDISILANTSAFIKESFSDISWSGFYLLQDGRLILGPFQGKTACSSISLGRGVCGKAAASLSEMIVPDVHSFQDHIACDSESKSELVIPLLVKRNLYGVLDLDSTTINRFNENAEDIIIIRMIAGSLQKKLQAD